ncbi:MAG: hypothetical protein QOD72_3930, partial [Acidimicrobiaceae bacterium]|nr:hypothetical protein [Acidimicrobiaceae bacterium]
MANSLLDRRTSRRHLIRQAVLASFGASAVLETMSARREPASAATVIDRVSMVGDSLTVGSLRYQAKAFAASGWEGSAIDAYGSRGIRTKVARDPHTGLTAVDALRASHGDTELWVVALGTNDAGIYKSSRYQSLIEQMLDRIGDDHRVTWVNIYLPRAMSRQQAWNDALATVAAGRPDQLAIYDWATLAAQHPSWLSSDHVHYVATGYDHR